MRSHTTEQVVIILQPPRRFPIESALDACTAWSRRRYALLIVLLKTHGAHGGELFCERGRVTRTHVFPQTFPLLRREKHI